MKYFLIAGERSGDLHGSNFIKALKVEDPAAEIQCWGGDEMEAAGALLMKHYRDLAFMGFWEVFKNIFVIRRNFQLCQQQVLDFNPDVLLLIDYGGFNMRMAKFAKKKGILTYYYIAPKVWAWNQKRALKIKRYVDRTFVILPFEEAFFARFNYPVDYVGNPLVDSISNFRKNEHFIRENHLGERPIIALLPGSRRQELDNILDLILTLSNDFDQYEFVVAGVDSLDRSMYQAAVSAGVKVVFGQTYDLLLNAEAAVVTSGTASLETALLNVPHIVTYKTSWLTYKIAFAIIQVKYLSLVNLIPNKSVVPELIQSELNHENLSSHLKKILIGGESREKMLENYAEIKRTLGDEPASGKLAKLVVSYMKKDQH